MFALGSPYDPGGGLAMAELTHIDDSGRPRMVDVTDKSDTEREAVAKGVVRMKPATFDMIKKIGVAKEMFWGWLNWLVLWRLRRRRT